ncbi:adenosine deaminase [Candidatus Dojkabacteria bacterium]|nr:adenosine deaminase [Candidatus Dojkabacteria bacterium]
MLTAHQVKKMPKVDLHRHIEGSIRPATILEYSRLKDILETRQTLSDYVNAMQVNGEEESLMEFIEKLGTRFMLKYTTCQEDIERFSYEACEDASNDSIVYLELRCCPSNYIKTPISIEEFIEGIYTGIQKAKEKYGIKTGLIVSIKREDHWEINQKVSKTVIDFFQEGKVNGIDLCGNEPMFPAREYKDLFKEFYKRGIPISIHAGEEKGAKGLENIKDAITLLHADRIGHGTFGTSSQRIISLIKEEDILCELCLTSNVHTKLIESVRKHPIFKFLECKVPVSINTDDPITSGITLTKEYINLIKYYNFSIRDFKKINLDAIKYSFQTKREKKAIKRSFMHKFDEWRYLLLDKYLI